MSLDDIQRILKDEMSGLEDRMMKMFKEILAKESEKMHNVIGKQNSIIEKLQEENKALNHRVNNLEQYSRRSNIQITNIPMVADENIEKIVCEIGQKVGVDINFRSDIQAAHRVPTSSQKSTQPIIVKFSNRQLRNEYIKKAKQAKLKCNQLDCTASLLFSGNNKIFFNDHLTPENSKLFFEVRKMVKENKIESAWTRDGKIFVRRVAGSPPFQIGDMHDLQPFLVPYSTAAAGSGATSTV